MNTWYLAFLPLLPFLAANVYFRWIGYVALVIISIDLIVNFLSKRGVADYKAGAFVIILFLFFGVLSFNNFTFQSFTQIIQFLLIYATLSRVGNDLVTKKYSIFYIYAYIFVISSALLFDLFFDLKLFFTNSNSYGVVGFCLVALNVKLFNYLKWKGWASFLFCVFPGILLIFFSYSRASMAAFSVMLYWIIISRLFKSLSFRVVFSLPVFLVPLVILYFAVNGLCVDISDFLPVVGDKSPFSGRDLIWQEIASVVSDHFWTGFGMGSLPGGILEGDYEGLSAHNGFMQIFYQMGLIGVFLLMLLCITVFYTASHKLNEQVSAAVLLGAFVHELFEVALIQNYFGVGFFIWLLVVLKTSDKHSKLSKI